MKTKLMKALIDFRRKCTKFTNQNETDAIEAHRFMRVWLQINGVEMYDLRRLHNNTVQATLNWFGLASCLLWLSLYSWIMYALIATVWRDESITELHFYSALIDTIQSYVVALVIYWKCITNKAHVKFWERLVEIDKDIGNLGFPYWIRVENKRLKINICKLACVQITFIVMHILIMSLIFQWFEVEMNVLGWIYIISNNNFIFMCLITPYNYAKAFEFRHRYLNELLQAVADDDHYSGSLWFADLARPNSNVFLFEKHSLLEKINAISKIFSKMYITKEKSTQTFGAISFSIVLDGIIKMIMIMFLLIEATAADTNNPVYSLVVIIFSQVVLTTFCSIYLHVSGFENVYREESKTSMIVQEIILQHVDEDVIDTASNFSLQLLHQRHKFTANGYFILDKKLLLSVISSMMTYLVILLQFATQKDIDSAAKKR